MYEEMMTNDDNLESNLLTSSLLEIRSPVADPGFPIGGCQAIGGGANLRCGCFFCENM